MPDIQKILLDEEAIARKVRELADAISRDYAGKELFMVSILKGAAVFTADLMRLVTVPVAVDFICASSYGVKTESSRNIEIKKDLDSDIRGKHVLLVDTIIDTGETIDALLKMFSARKPASLKIAALLDKKSRRTVEIPLAYRGFEIPDAFVVGYGLDCAEQYRNLPYIAAINVSR